MVDECRRGERLWFVGADAEGHPAATSCRVAKRYVSAIESLSTGPDEERVSYYYQTRFGQRCREYRTLKRSALYRSERETLRAAAKACIERANALNAQYAVLMNAAAAAKS